MNNNKDSSAPSPAYSNVIDLFSGSAYNPDHSSRIIRLSPELDGLCMLYASSSDDGRYYCMKILAWALRENGEVVAVVPWLNGVKSCAELDDAAAGEWEGYYNVDSNVLFFDPPEHKVLELDAAAEYFATADNSAENIIQEFPDVVGTHALFIDGAGDNITLAEVASWRLMGDGSIKAMLIDDDQVTHTPVLTGDPCLYSADEHADFRYYFQHHAANQIKDQDPDAMAAIALLIGE